MPTPRAPMPPTSDTRQVGGISAHTTCTHALNLRHQPGSGHQWPPPVPPRPQPPTPGRLGASVPTTRAPTPPTSGVRSEEHTSELQSLMRISYAVFCLKKKTNYINNNHARTIH